MATHASINTRKSLIATVLTCTMIVATATTRADDPLILKPSPPKPGAPAQAPETDEAKCRKVIREMLRGVSVEQLPVRKVIHPPTDAAQLHAFNALADHAEADARLMQIVLESLPSSDRQRHASQLAEVHRQIDVLVERMSLTIAGDSAKGKTIHTTAAGKSVEQEFTLLRLNGEWKLEAAMLGLDNANALATKAHERRTQAIREVLQEIAEGKHAKPYDGRTLVSAKVRNMGYQDGLQAAAKLRNREKAKDCQEEGPGRAPTPKESQQCRDIVKAYVRARTFEVMDLPAIVHEPEDATHRAEYQAMATWHAAHTKLVDACRAKETAEARAQRESSHNKLSARIDETIDAAQLTMFTSSAKLVANITTESGGNSEKVYTLLHRNGAWKLSPLALQLGKDRRAIERLVRRTEATEGVLRDIESGTLEPNPTPSKLVNARLASMGFLQGWKDATAPK